MGYREPKTGKTKTVTIESLGYLDVLQKDFADPLSHFKEIVRKMNAEKAQENLPISIKINKNEKLIEGTNNRKNFAYAAPSKIYHELEIDKFLTILKNNTNQRIKLFSMMSQIIILK